MEVDHPLLDGPVEKLPDLSFGVCRDELGLAVRSAETSRELLLVENDLMDVRRASVAECIEVQLRSLPEVRKQNDQVWISDSGAQCFAHVHAWGQRPEECKSLLIHPIKALEFHIAERRKPVLLHRSWRAGMRTTLGAFSRYGRVRRGRRHLDDPHPFSFAGEPHPCDALVDVLAKTDCCYEEALGSLYEDGAPVADSEAIQARLALQRLDVQTGATGGETKLSER
jgi:hypothetical protein